MLTVEGVLGTRMLVLVEEALQQGVHPEPVDGSVAVAQHVPERLEGPGLRGQLSRNNELLGLLHLTKDFPLLLRQSDEGLGSLLALDLVDILGSHGKRAVLEQETRDQAEQLTEQAARGSDYPFRLRPQESFHITIRGTLG